MDRSSCPLLGLPPCPSASLATVVASGTVRTLRETAAVLR
jgi:hypothetical protein